MTFKTTWEKTALPQNLSTDVIVSMMKKGCRGCPVTSYEMISGGCANINLKVFLEGEKNPRLLRVYLRDTESSRREQKLGNLLGSSVPIPQIEYRGNFEGYTFAIASFLEGITLRELLLGQETYDLEAIMLTVGLALARIASHKFSHPGFFDDELEIQADIKQPDFQAIGKVYLQDEAVASFLGKDTVQKIWALLEDYDHLFSNRSESNLVHGDFGPENILVIKRDGPWQISGILDWEFAFSGSTLWDVANMVRYGYKMPPGFEDAFIRGLSEGGVVLPNQWRPKVRILNIFSLLDVLARRDFQTHPRTWADSKEVIHEMLSFFNRE